MDKPIKPTDLMPRSFGGVKNNFSASLQSSGYEDGVPAIYGGDNLNYQLDATGKELDYCEKISDYIKDIPINKSIITDPNNKLVYTQYSIRTYNSSETYSLNDVVMSIIDDEVKLFKSLANSNIGNALTDDTKWVEISLGGGGLEIGDIGIAPLGIDETQGKRRYLNGQVIIQDQFTSFTQKLKSAVTLYPSLACTEAQWQATVALSVGGQCGKFVIDDVAGTIRLPKIIMPIQGLTNLTNLAEIVEAGLPNITGSCVNGDTINFTGAFYSGGSSSSNISAPGGSVDTIMGFDASLSNSIYGNSNTVQQEQIQYPYFIQVATGVEESVDVTREIELNNPFSLLDYKFSEYELDNISWLRSNGQYNAKAVFPDTYDLLLMIYNETATKAGVSVKLSTETYTDYDFVLNTTDETFRLPTKVKLASGKAIVGNGTSLGFTTGSIDSGVVYSGSGSNLFCGYTGVYGEPVGTNYTGSTTVGANKSIGLTTDSTKSGMELSDSDLYLYFYVGETVQNASLINAGRIEEKLVNLIPDNSSLIAGYAMPSSTYENLTVGATGTTYTAPANGYFFLRGQGADGTYIGLYEADTYFGMRAEISGGSAHNAYINLPVRKGQIITLIYSVASILNFRFFYAQGSESEAL